jgi:hypothetical protein
VFRTVPPSFTFDYVPPCHTWIRERALLARRFELHIQPVYSAVAHLLHHNLRDRDRDHDSESDNFECVMIRDVHCHWVLTDLVIQDIIEVQVMHALMPVFQVLMSRR